MFADEIQREQRMAQMVEHAHEDHEVKPLAQRAYIVHVELREFDVVKAQRFTRQSCLSEITLVTVNAEDAIRAAALHFDRIKAGVAADIENALAVEIIRQMRREATEF